MTLFDQALKEIDNGKVGLNIGLDMGFDRLTEYLPNIQPGTMYNIGGRPKDGKTAFVDECFLYRPYEAFMNNKDSNIDVEWNYFSFEIDKVKKIIKGIGRRLYRKYGIVADINKVLSRGKHKISQEIYDKVLECREYFNQLEDKLNIFNISDIGNPTGIYKYLKERSVDEGKLIFKNVFYDGEDHKKLDRYIPNNSSKYNIDIIDHIALTKSEDGLDTKHTIDRLLQYMIELRNVYRRTPVIVQQLAINIDNTRRNKCQFKPVIEDWGDSRYSIRDSEIIMALFNPSSFELHTDNHYDIDILGNRYRNLEIIYNRDGDPNINIGLEFIGEVGAFNELPPTSKIDYNKYLNNKY